MWKLLLIGNRRSKDKTLDRIYPLVGFLTQLFQNNKLPLSNILALITSKDKPVNFFGRNINWMKPALISKLVKNYIQKGVFDLSLLEKRDRFYSNVNELTIKHIMINKIEFLINKIDAIDHFKNRINLLDHLFTSDQLEGYYFYVVTDLKKSLELEKDLTDRWYFIDPVFKNFKLGFIQYSPFANIFFNNKSGTYPDLRLLSQGLDIDLTFDINSKV